MMLHIMSTNLTSISLACSVQSRRYWGAFGGLASPNKAPSPPPIETWNTINQLRFCQFLECQAPPHKPKAPLLKTFWRRFWFSSHRKLMFLDFQQLDYERNNGQRYFFTIKAVNVHLDPDLDYLGPLEDKAEVVVKVIDVDEPPEFTKTDYEFFGELMEYFC